MMSRPTCLFVFLFGSVLLVSVAVGAEEGSKEAPFINTWLVTGTFENDRENTGFERDWIDEMNVEPQQASPAGGKEPSGKKLLFFFE